MAQLPFMGGKEPDGKPIIHYYKFYNGIQMIEFDNLSAYHQRVNYLEQAQPRALTWEMVLGPPPANVYLFRNEAGEIIKQFGSHSGVDLMDVEKSKKIAICHNSISSMIGSVFGFSQIGTRYYPYYLTGITQGGLGLIDSLGNVVLRQNYSTIWKGNGVFITRTLNSVYELRDKHLKLKFSDPDYFLQPSQRISGFVDVGKDKKYGLMDSTGQFVAECKYDMLINGFNSLGLARVQRNGKVGFINRSGKEVIDCEYQNVGEFTEGLCNARLNDKWGYIDLNGKTIIPHKFDIGISFHEGLARIAFRESGNWLFGYINKKGEEVIKPQYSNAKDFHNGIAEVMINNKWKKIDKKGRLVR